MLFKDYTYSVLIVSSSEKFTSSIIPMLPENLFGPVEKVKTVNEARRKLVDRNYNIILINTPLNDEFGTKFALDAITDNLSSVLMFIKSELYEEVSDKVINYGIFTLQKPLSSSILYQILKIIYAIQEKFKLMEKKKETLESKMEEIRLVNHAKWILINHVKVTEEEAHNIIEKQAMNTRRTKKEVAEGIIKTYNN